jgi:hypothetical protein
MTPEEATQVDFDPFDVSEYGRGLDRLVLGTLANPLLPFLPRSQDLAPSRVPYARGRCFDLEQEPRG